MRKLITLFVIIILSIGNLYAQCPFIAPDTVCVGDTVNITDFTGTDCGTNHQWYYASARITDSVKATLLTKSFPGKTLTYISSALVNNNFYSFVNSHLDGLVYRLDFGATLQNLNPASVQIADLKSYASVIEGIALVQDKGIWYVFITAGMEWSGPADSKLIRLTLGNGINNLPTKVENLGNFGQKFHFPLEIKMINDNGHWYGFVANSQTKGSPGTPGNSITVIDFENGLNSDTSSIKATECIIEPDVRNNQNLSVSGVAPVKYNGTWRLFVVGMKVNDMFRMDFQTDMKTYKTTRIPNPSGTLSGPRDLSLVNDCDHLMGMAINTGDNSFSTLSFDSTVTGTISGTNYKDAVDMPHPHGLSDFYHLGNEIYSIVINSTGYITMLKFNPNAALVQTSPANPMDTAFAPAKFTYTAPGIFNISLVVDKEVNKTSCRTVVVKYPPGAPMLIIPTELCKGAPLMAIVPDSVNGQTVRYEWTYPSGIKSFLNNPPANDSGIYKVKLFYDQCKSKVEFSDTVTTSDSPPGPKILNTTPTGCPNDPTKISIMGLKQNDVIRWYTDATMTQLVFDTITKTINSYYIAPPQSAGMHPYYIVRRPKSQGYCKDTVSKPLVIKLKLVYPPAPAMDGGGKTVCLGDALSSLTATPAMLGVKWYSDVTLSTLVYQGNTYNPTDDIKSGGSYSFYATYDSTKTCRSDAGIVTVNVKETPQPDFTIDARCESSITKTDKFSITSNLPGAVISLFGSSETFIKKGSSPLEYQHNNTIKGVYHYSVSQFANGCESLKKPVDLTILKTEPPVLLMYDTNYYSCLGDAINTLRVKADSNATKVEWYEGSTPVSYSPIYTPQIDKNQLVSHTFKVRQQVNNCFSLYNQVVLSIISCIDVDVSLCNTMPDYDLFTAQSIPVRTFHWQDNDGTGALTDSLVDLKNTNVIGSKTFQYNKYRVKMKLDKQFYAGFPIDTVYKSCLSNIDLFGTIKDFDLNGTWFNDLQALSSSKLQLDGGMSFFKYRFPQVGACKADSAQVKIKADATVPQISCVKTDYRNVQVGLDAYEIENSEFDAEILVDDSCLNYNLHYILNSSEQGDSTLNAVHLPLGENVIKWIIKDDFGRTNECYTKVTVSTFKVPNLFTPNGDGENDQWMVILDKTPNAIVQIYNRWGVKVYESKHDNAEGTNIITWDGRMSNGGDAPSDGYQYVISDGKKVLYKGSVTIMR